MAKRIKILPGGPYAVPGDIPLRQAVIETGRDGASDRWGKGKRYDNPSDKPYHLCRCGESGDKPFCDGTHAKIGFEGTEHAGKHPYLDGCKVYRGQALDLYDNESLCASMRFCDPGKGVWQAAMDSDDPESRELAITEACACAAGRLTLRDKDGTAIEPAFEPEVSPVEDTAAGRRGPLWVKGGIEIEGADGEVYEVRNRMTLCRCGQSKNMPYCDISHMRCEHMEGFDQ